MEFSKALDMARKHFGASGGSQIACALDAGVCWIFYGGSMEEQEIGGVGIKIKKDSGKVEDFILPDDDNFELLDRAVEISLNQ